MLGEFVLEEVLTETVEVDDEEVTETVELLGGEL